jgi:alanine dehydrogenase
MRIGVPREIKQHEYRVGLMPFAVREFARHGHEVIVEAGAGAGSGAADEDYAKAGARIVATAVETFEQADMIVKVKEPQPIEWKRLRENQILFTYLHLAADAEQAHGLLESGVTAVAYETVTDEQGGLPQLAPKSEVAGRLSIEAAGSALRRHSGGRGLLLGGVPGVKPARVVVLGGGVVGTNAARMAVGLGAEVTIVERSLARLRELDQLFGGRVRTRAYSQDTVEEEIAGADAVIGAVLIPGASAPKLVSRAMLGLMRRDTVVVDVAIDQGGCFETSRPTTHDAPIYVVDGIIHYCVANMPGAVPLSSSVALGNATLALGLRMAAKGLGAIARDRDLSSGLNIHHGKVYNAAVAESLGLSWRDPSELRGAGSVH